MGDVEVEALACRSAGDADAEPRPLLVLLDRVGEYADSLDTPPEAS